MQPGIKNEPVAETAFRSTSGGVDATKACRTLLAAGEAHLPLLSSWPHVVHVFSIFVSSQVGCLAHNRYSGGLRLKSNPILEQTVPGPSAGANRVCGQNSQQRIALG